MYLLQNLKSFKTKTQLKHK